MRTALLALALAACAPSTPLPTECSPACPSGQVCLNAQCLIPADSGSDAAPDVLGVDVATIDTMAPTDVFAETGANDAGGIDAVDGSEPPRDAGTDATPAPTDVRADVAEACRRVTMECDGRIVNIQGGERDGGRGQTFFCGACNVTCEAGEFCVNCYCTR